MTTTPAPTKPFHIGDVLSILTGKLVSPRHMEGVYDICDWMSGASNMTHQLPRVAREIEPDLRRQHPELAAVEAPTLSNEQEVLAWLRTLYPVHGTTVEVARLTDPNDHTTIDPLTELGMLRSDARVIVLNADAEGKREA